MKPSRRKSATCCADREYWRARSIVIAVSPDLVSSHPHHHQTLRRYLEAELAPLHADVLGGRHAAGPAQRQDLRSCRVSRPPHGIEGGYDVAMIVIQTPDRGTAHAAKVRHVHQKALGRPFRQTLHIG